MNSLRSSPRLTAALLVAAAALAGCGEEESAPAPACAPPDPACTPHFQGLSADVDVRRDNSGVVHVYGKTDADVVYGSGYMQALDRLFQMDLVRRRALGRRAEVLGEGFVGDDRIIRMIDIPRWARANAERTAIEHPEVYVLIEAWTAGVNARIAEVNAGDAPMPQGFEDLDYAPEVWDIADGFAVGKLILFGNANQLEYDILSTAVDLYSPELYEAVPFFAPLLPVFPLTVDEVAAAGASAKSLELQPSLAVSTPSTHAASVALPADAQERLRRFSEEMRGFRPSASNNWAVRGEHTENGRSIIAGDPHQGLQSPSLMWTHHMNSADAGGTIDVAGWTFVGTPGVSLGHNRKLAWTATTTYPDITDVWSVEVTASDTAVIGDTEVAIVPREEVIQVKDADPITFKMEDVPGYGVLVLPEVLPLPVTDPGERVLFNWTGFTGTDEAYSFFSFDVAETIEDFEAAADGMELGCFNFVAATADDITYRSSPAVPDRGAPGDLPPSFRMLDGSDASTFWTGDLLPPSQLPHSRGEERGFVVTANNEPFGFTGDGSLEGDPFYFGVYFDPGARAARIEELLGPLVDAGDITVEDIQSIQSDTRSLLAEEMLPFLFDTYANVPTDPALAAYQDRPDLDQLVTLLQAWDHHMERDSSAAVAFHGFMFFLTRAAVEDDMGIFYEPVLDQEPLFPIKFAIFGLRDPSLPIVPAAEHDLTILGALDETSAWLTARFGGVDPANYTWGDIHGTYFGSIWGAELDGGFWPTDGSTGTVNVSSAAFFDGEGVRERFESHGGSIYRMVASFDDDGTPQAVFNMPRGNSGDPESPHWADTHDDWVEDRYRPLAFRDEDIEADTDERLTLSP